MTSKKVLFVKLSALGDIVMALPAARYLKSQGCEVTWLCGEGGAGIVESYSGVDEILRVNEKSLLAGNFFEKVTSVLKVNLKLSVRSFDHVILGHADPRYSFLLKTVSAPAISFKASRERHHAEAYFEMAQRLFNDQSSRVEDFLPQPLKPWKGRASKKVAIAPGGAKNVLADDDLRRWPPEHYASLAKKLIQRGYEVHLFGAPSDAWVRPSFIGLGVQDHIGQYGLKDLIATWSDYRLMVTHDSGPLHLASLAGLPVLGLFGPTLPAWRFPKGNAGFGLTLDQLLDCQPCYDGKRYAICDHKNCLRGLSPDFVWTKISDSRLGI